MVAMSFPFDLRRARARAHTAISSSILVGGVRKSEGARKRPGPPRRVVISDTARRGRLGALQAPPVHQPPHHRERELVMKWNIDAGAADRLSVNRYGGQQFYYTPPHAANGEGEFPLHWCQ